MYIDSHTYTTDYLYFLFSGLSPLCIVFIGFGLHFRVFVCCISLSLSPLQHAFIFRIIIIGTQINASESNVLDLVYSGRAVAYYGQRVDQ